MNQKLLPMLLLLSWTCGGAGAHPITVDGNVGDWAAVAGASNTSSVALGEFTWTDAPNDERTDFSNSSDLDLRLLGITGDSTNLYLRAQFSTLSAFGESTMLQIAVRRDAVFPVRTEFVGFSETFVPTADPWQRLIVARSDLSDLGIHSGDNTFTPGGAAVTNQSSGVMEFSVPWTLLGSPPPFTPIRFFTAVFRSNSSGDTFDVAGSEPLSDAMDAVTNVMGNTFDEVVDNIINFSVDIVFDESGNVIGPAQAPLPPTSLLLAMGIVALGFARRPRERVLVLSD